MDIGAKIYFNLKKLTHTKFNTFVVVSVGLVLVLIIIKSPQNIINQAAISHCWAYEGECNSACTYKSPSETSGYSYECVSDATQRNSCEKESKYVLVQSKYTAQTEKSCDDKGYGTCFLPTEDVVENGKICPYRSTYACKTYPEITSEVKECEYVEVTGTSPPSQEPPASGQDTTAPTVTISSPANNTQVTKGSSLTIRATASDNVGVSKVEFYNGMQLLNTDTTSAYSYAFAVPNVDGATYALQAKAYDTAGNVGESGVVTVTTPQGNSGDATPVPGGCWAYNGKCDGQCLYADPGTSVAGYEYTCLYKNYYNPSACTKVTKAVVGTNFCATSGNGSCYKAIGGYDWNESICQTASIYGNCKSYPKLTDSMEACAYIPPSGGTSPPQGPPSGQDTTAPTVTISSPANNTQVTKGSSLTIRATASDNVGVSKVEFYNGMQLLNTDTTSAYSYAFAVPNVDGATYALQAKAYDTAGNVGISSLVSVTTPQATPPSGSGGSELGKCWGFNGECNSQCTYNRPYPNTGYSYTCLQESSNPYLCKEKKYILVSSKSTTSADKNCDMNGGGACYIPTGPVETNAKICPYASTYYCTEYPEITTTVASCKYIDANYSPADAGGGTGADTTPPSGSNTLKVLSLAYFPIKNNYLDLDVVNNFIGEYNMSLAQVRSKVNSMNDGVEEILEEGSKFHGYSNTNASPAIDYNIIEEREYLQPIPISNKTNPFFGGYLTDYNKLLLDNNICSLVDNEGVREVWLWSYTGHNKSGWESNFTSDWGDISNSDGDPSDMPKCNHSYTVYEYNYGQPDFQAVEDHIHQFERIFRYIDDTTFWNEYVGYFPSRTEQLANQDRRCGWAHYPPNGRYDYDWTNSEYVYTDCKDWKIGGGSRSYLNCTSWGCTQRGWFIMWMQSMPTRWWDYIKDFDYAIGRNRSLVP